MDRPLGKYHPKMRTGRVFKPSKRSGIKARLKASSVHVTRSTGMLRPKTISPQVTSRKIFLKWVVALRCSLKWKKKGGGLVL